MKGAIGTIKISLVIVALIILYSQNSSATTFTVNSTPLWTNTGITVLATQGSLLRTRQPIGIGAKHHKILDLKEIITRGTDGMSGSQTTGTGK
jgi:hypothetical protein